MMFVDTAKTTGTAICRTPATAASRRFMPWLISGLCVLLLSALLSHTWLRRLP